MFHQLIFINVWTPIFCPFIRLQTGTQHMLIVFMLLHAMKTMSMCWVPVCNLMKG